MIKIPTVLCLALLLSGCPAGYYQETTWHSAVLKGAPSVQEANYKLSLGTTVEQIQLDFLCQGTTTISVDADNAYYQFNGGKKQALLIGTPIENGTTCFPGYTRMIAYVLRAKTFTMREGEYRFYVPYAVDGQSHVADITIRANVTKQRKFGVVGCP